MGIRKTLKVRGRRHLRAYHARIRERGEPTRTSDGDRWFCGACGSHLYLTDDRWPGGVWPNVAAIDTALPAAPERVLMMTRYAPRWTPSELLKEGTRFPRYPKLSIADWHQQHGWTVTMRP